jgi:hypothetical protein
MRITIRTGTSVMARMDEEPTARVLVPASEDYRELKVFYIAGWRRGLHPLLHASPA